MRKVVDMPRTQRRLKLKYLIERERNQALAAEKARHKRAMEQDGYDADESKSDADEDYMQRTASVPSTSLRAPWDALRRVTTPA
tara:strand:- start:751 stop:1002 length:252 start_codon:yes stop_codon:yes gene_type:complete